MGLPDCKDCPISIHAPRAGRDKAQAAGREWSRHFNPRAPCGARRWWCGRNRRRWNFNPRAPCGARPAAAPPLPMCTAFQSTRPVRGATPLMRYTRSSSRFQSTRPVRGATALQVWITHGKNISIHAPRAGRDRPAGQAGYSRPHFNPRAPCGARRRTNLLAATGTYFNPRAPCGARRGLLRPVHSGRGMSIHAPRAGRDWPFLETCLA